jgi:hypothetical protein
MSWRPTRYRVAEPARTGRASGTARAGAREQGRSARRRCFWRPRLHSDCPASIGFRSFGAVVGTIAGLRARTAMMTNAPPPGTRIFASVDDQGNCSRSPDQPKIAILLLLCPRDGGRRMARHLSTGNGPGNRSIAFSDTPQPAARARASIARFSRQDRHASNSFLMCGLIRKWDGSIFSFILKWRARGNGRRARCHRLIT